MQGFGGETRGKETTWKTQAWMGQDGSSRSEMGAWTGLVWFRIGAGDGLL